MAGLSTKNGKGKRAVARKPPPSTVTRGTSANTVLNLKKSSKRGGQLMDKSNKQATAKSTKVAFHSYASAVKAK